MYYKQRLGIVHFFIKIFYDFCYNHNSTRKKSHHPCLMKNLARTPSHLVAALNANKVVLAAIRMHFGMGKDVYVFKLTENFLFTLLLLLWAITFQV